MSSSKQRESSPSHPQASSSSHHYHHQRPAPSSIPSVDSHTLLSTRQPSWTPSLPESSLLFDNNNPRRGVKRRRSSKRSEENLMALTPLSSNYDWMQHHQHGGFSSFPGNSNVQGQVQRQGKRRRPSFPPSVGETIFHQRARRPRIEPPPEDDDGDEEAEFEGEENEEESPIEVSITRTDKGKGKEKEDSSEAESPQESKSLHSSWEINVKDLVGDAVGNMSISPTSRDIVLAARRGLFIIDLEYPLRIPRFLPQGGTWDVADVQWNPHPSHAQYIVSTSSEKLLIWNLYMTGKTSIAHILKSHYRAITDINWHTSEPDIVVSTGIDSWIWAWDLREPGRPIFGLSAFKAGGTQVKWNYQDPNLLASSHSNEVLIWDRRIYGIDWARPSFASSPSSLSSSSTSSGTHLSHMHITTCSLDMTIKTFNINAPNLQGYCEPVEVIKTGYPVWRARNLPFGEGLLSLPQRGETGSGNGEEEGPKLVETFEGHSDVVKEFVWRKGKHEDFQLITWSKDRTLRFWPIDAEVMQKVGHVPNVERGRSKFTRTEREDMEREEAEMEVDALTSAVEDEPLPLKPPPLSISTLSSPNESSIHPGQSFASFSLAPPTGMDADGELGTDTVTATPTITNTRDVAIINFIGHAGRRGSLSISAAAGPHGHGLAGLSAGMNTNAGTTPTRTMSKGGTGLMSKHGVSKQMDQLTWLASVKSAPGVGVNAGGGEGSSAASASASGDVPSAPASVRAGGSRSKPGSKSGSRSRQPSEGDESGIMLQRSESTIDIADEKDKAGITSVLTKLAASKIKLEKHDLIKKRTCTLGLHGPWGETSSVFMRVTFTFPKDYPAGTHPHGTPNVELERNPLISMSDRAYILRHLRRIRERKRPCLEACLRFLLFADEGRMEEGDGESSSSDDGIDEDDTGRVEGGKKARDVTVSLLRNNKNLAEPRTSQGAFGPNGELICFFRAPPRLVRNVLRDLTGTGAGVSKGADSAATTSATAQPQAPPEDQQTPQLQPPYKASYFQSPALVSDAVRRLGLAAQDRTVQPIDPRKPETELNILRAMTNLLTIPQRQLRHDSNYGARGHSQYPAEDSGTAGASATGQNRYATLLATMRRSTVFLSSTRYFTGADQKVAEDYVFSMALSGDGMGSSSGSNSLGEVCERNAAAARKHGRFDHERVFRTLRTLFVDGGDDEGTDEKSEKWSSSRFASDTLAAMVIKRLYAEVAKEKDVQMLAMIAMLVLQTYHPAKWTVIPPSLSRKKESTPSIPFSHLSQRHGGLDYFNLTKSINSPASTPAPSSLAAPSVASSSNSNSSSKGSWSSLFNTGSMRQFMNGVQDSISFRDGPSVTTPSEILTPTTTTSVSGVIDGLSSSPGGAGSVRSKRVRKDSSIYSPSSGVAPRSWNEGTGGGHSSVKGGGSSRLTPESSVSYMMMTHGKKAVVFQPAAEEKISPPLFEDTLMEQFKLNVYAYAELLFRWQMHQRRLELLKAVTQHDHDHQPAPRLPTLQKKTAVPTIQTEVHQVGLLRICSRRDCRAPLPEKSNACSSCGTSCLMPACTVCRLPVKGLSRTCLSCSHVTHISCWNSLDLAVPICPAGCGCFCNGFDGPFTRPSTRLGFTPPMTSSMVLVGPSE
ncbi:hypothetical protein CPB84DRAFT_1813522 [Gymnopilus junonius]|uniref:WDR59/RTC1-like RING zinc finger domain-containing protein n=1 Tax=Gymnopilus junonius TaxID=109634 RepID=A0A9P5NV47_GYMJU|nr:hypothetical protein CPB84DRAFT_1813522 [Gymnopilus junonius]